MKSQKSRMVLLTLGVVAALLLITFQSAAGAGASGGSWTTGLFESNTSEEQISTVFGGPTQIPIISSIDAGQKAFVLKFPEIGGDGSCGPGNTWQCWSLYEPEMESDHISEVAEHTYVQSFVLSWVWVRNDGDVYRYYQEWVANSTELALVDSGNEMIYRPPTGSSVVGRPSLALDPSGNAHVALLSQMESTPFMRSIIYLHWSNNTGSTCGFSSRYQCDTIEAHSILVGSIGPYPKITVNSSYEPAILFYDGYTNFLTYAYPRSNTSYSPNCGPGDNTWRCVEVSDSLQSGSVIELAIGEDITRPQIAWSYTDGLSQTWMHHARYVGSGGNCGDDYYRNLMGIIVHGNVWSCHEVALIGNNPIYTSVSLQVDNENNPVIAINSGDGVFRLGVIYGFPDETYVYQIVESGPINTGKNASLALSATGRGFIAYIQDEEYSPNLRFALQNLTTFIPFVQR